LIKALASSPKSCQILWERNNSYFSSSFKNHKCDNQTVNQLAVIERYGIGFVLTQSATDHEKSENGKLVTSQLSFAQIKGRAN
jgi:hypothetical protein